MRLTFSLRERWNNSLGNQGIDPLEICQPSTVEQLVALVHKAERENVTVRAVGKGHSWSDVALTSGFVIDTGALNRVLELEEDVIEPRSGGAPLVRVEGGITLAELNEHLEAKGLALPNMSGYDGMTIAGVTSTSTHGSGIAFGPLSDFVRSLDLVASGGRLYRIEPTDGLTNPAAFHNRHRDWTLVQDDHWFQAAVVGMGSLGIVYSMILAVQKSYWLREVRVRSDWDEVRKDLAGGDVLHEHRHYEVYVNPYETDGKHHCIVTTRDIVSAEEARRDWHRTRHMLSELLAKTPIFPLVINLIVGLWPKITPRLIDFALSRLADADYTNVSYRVLNIGAANGLPAYSAEIGVPRDADGTHIRAVERIFDVAAEHQRLGQVYQTSPISLRFVKASDSYLSMMQGRETMMIELISLSHTEGGTELLAAYEEALYEMDGRPCGRPHWGQLNTLNSFRVRDLYPELDRWLDIRDQLDQTGVFNSPFTKRVGVSQLGFASGQAFPAHASRP
jgi:FAD/FMN-containing dehydrogenase